MKYWIEISAKGSILDYILEDFPIIEDLSDYFGCKYDMQMVPQEYYLSQKAVKFPPVEWLHRELDLSEMELKFKQKRVSELRNEARKSALYRIKLKDQND